MLALSPKPYLSHTHDACPWTGAWKGPLLGMSDCAWGKPQATAVILKQKAGWVVLGETLSISEPKLSHRPGLVLSVVSRVTLEEFAHRSRGVVHRTQS